VGNIRAGKGMKMEVIAHASGLPLGLEVAAADVSEQVHPGAGRRASRGAIRHTRDRGQGARLERIA
jgi:hypothetical protein